MTTAAIESPAGARGLQSKTARREAEDVALVMRARSGDGAAFEEVWRRTLVFLRRPLRRLLPALPWTWSLSNGGRRRTELDDALQEGLLGAWRAVLSFDPKRGQALVHVACGARSAIQGHLRRQVTLRRLNAEDPTAACAAFDCFAGDLAATGSLPVLYGDLYGEPRDVERRAA